MTNKNNAALTDVATAIDDDHVLIIEAKVIDDLLFACIVVRDGLFFNTSTPAFFYSVIETGGRWVVL